MIKKEIIYEVTRKVPHCFVGGGYADLEAYGYIEKISGRKFLWWKLKDKYKIHAYSQQIRCPFYDGEYDTNQKLDMAREDVKFECEKWYLKHI